MQIRPPHTFAILLAMALAPVSAAADSSVFLQLNEPEDTPAWAIPHGGEFWHEVRPVDGGVDVGTVIDRVQHAFRIDGATPRVVGSGYRAHLDPEGAVLQIGAAALRISTRTVAGARQSLAGPADEPWVIVGNTAQRRLLGDASIVEHLEARRDHVELTWVLPERPAAEALAVTVDLGGMNWERDDDGGHILAGGGERAAIGEVIAVDGAGLRWALPSRIESGALQFTVPPELLRGATYPLAIDPTFGPAYPLDPVAARGDPDGQYQPSVASNGDDFYVAWYGFDFSGPGPASAIRGARVGSDGRIKDPYGTLILGTGTSPHVAYADGRYLVGWIDSEYRSTGSVYRVRGQLVDADSGTLVGIPLSLEPWTTDRLSYLELAGGHRRFAAVYERGDGIVVRTVHPSGTLDRMRRIDVGGVDIQSPDIAAGAAGWLAVAVYAGADYDVVRIDLDTSLGIGSIDRLNGSNAGEAFAEPAIAANGTDVMAVWQREDLSTHETSIMGSVSPAFPPFLVSKGTHGYEVTPDVEFVDFDGNRAFIVVWSSDISGYGDHRELRARTYATGGRAHAPSFPVHRGPAPGVMAEYAPRIASNGSIALVAWEDYRTHHRSGFDIYAARLDLKFGVLEDPNILVSGDEWSPEQQQFEPAIAVSEHGDFLVAWSDRRFGNGDILAALVKYDGALITPAGVNLSNSSYTDAAPDVARLEDGFFVVWEEKGRSPTYSRILGSPVNYHMGTPGVGHAISNPTHDADARRPAVVSHADSGLYFVAWDDRIPGAHRDIRGVGVKPAWTHNDLTHEIVVGPHPEEQREVALASNGEAIVAAWSDHRTGEMGDERNVFASQVFFDGQNFKSTSATEASAYADLRFGSSGQYRPALASDETELFLLTFTNDTHHSSDATFVVGVPLESLAVDTPPRPHGAEAIGKPSLRGDHSTVAWSSEGYEVVWQDEFLRRPRLVGATVDSGVNVLNRYDVAETGTLADIACVDAYTFVAFEQPIGGATAVWGVPGTP